MKGKLWSVFAWGVVALTLLECSWAMDTGEVIKKVPTSHKIVALTFDDGPDPVTTPHLLKVLSAKYVKATFFVLGEKAEKYPELLKCQVDAGHELAVHGYTHRYINRLTIEELNADLQESERVLSVVGVRPSIFRPPGGGYNDLKVAQLKQRGYTTVLWSVDPRDWEGRSVGQITNSVLKLAGPGSIILLHEGQCAPSTPAALAVIIDKLREQGYTFATVSELLQYYEIRQ